MEEINRRRILLGMAAASTAGVAVAAEPKPLTPDERIERGIAEITAAFREKWPDCPVRITDYDNETKGMVIVLTHVGDDAPGSINYDRSGTARRKS